MVTSFANRSFPVANPSTKVKPHNVAPALGVASSWVAGRCFCQERAQAATLGNVVIKRDSQCPPQCFVLIPFSSPLRRIMRGWIPWVMTNLASFSFSAHSVFLLHGSQDADFQDAGLAPRQLWRNVPPHWQHPWPRGPEWSWPGWESSGGFSMDRAAPLLGFWKQ